jgi:tetratricopeptide (TPR) repeat protein
MKLRIESLATLLLIAVTLLDGCSGCEQKTQQKTTDYNRELENVRQAKLKALTATKGLSTDERRRRRIEILIEGLDDMAAARICVSNRSWKAARPYLDKALAENPNDFETMLFWVENVVSTLENELDYTLNRKKVEVFRRLYKMNPNHHRVLYGLGRSIYKAYPEEALGYAQKAFELEPKHYANFPLLAKCYMKTGQYEKALAEYQRVFKSAGTNVPPDVLAGFYHIHRILELKDDVYREQYEKNQKRWHMETRKRLGLE